ncbi:hypothetical protein TNCT_223191 [Trichonephila clavata]|uniref:Uncharacterized protein n=1 Tax=Trichonephila clavata TaxID=2740835 RepID=A0A8X6L675_TRICU|nr:hypothetical protein TNCT_223191 [Trichonephila clavata]
MSITQINSCPPPNLPKREKEPFFTGSSPFKVKVAPSLAALIKGLSSFIYQRKESLEFLLWSLEKRRDDQRHVLIPHPFPD